MFLKLISRRTLLSRTSSSSQSPYSIFTAQCSTSSPSLLTDSHAHSHPDSRKAKVSVWWDLDRCTVPRGVNTFGVAHSIASAVEDAGIEGPIQINAFGDNHGISKTTEWALTKTGVTLTHVCKAVIFNADDALLSNLNDWVAKNPPPANVFLISDCSNFVPTLRVLRERKYNILLATNVSSDLISCATIMWPWDALVRGENLTRRYFNHPPHNFWYGQYKGFLEDHTTAAVEIPVIRNLNWCDETFMTDIHTWINSDIGSAVLKGSRTRGNLANYFQDYGPSILKSVTESDVRLMIDMLIEKKVVHESPFAIRPFNRPEDVENAPEDPEKKIKKLTSKVHKLEKESEEKDIKIKVAKGLCIRHARCFRKKT